MTISKIRVLDKTILKHAPKTHYSRDTSFVEIARFIHHYSAHPFKKGDFLCDTGRAEFGQARDFKMLTIYYVVRATRCFVEVIKFRGYGEEKRKWKINSKTGIAYCVEHVGMFKRKPLNFVFEKFTPTKASIDKLLGKITLDSLKQRFMQWFVDHGARYE